MAIRFGRATRVAPVIVALLLIALPAAAAHTPPHAVEEIWNVVAEANQAMTTVVDDFEVAITGMQDPADVDAAEIAADAEVTAIWTAARNQIDDLAKLYKGIGQQVTAARQELQQTRNAARAEIAALADAWVPPVPLTTTTTTLATTTSTAPPSTTTTTPSKGNSGTPPSSGGGGNGNGNGSGSGTGSGTGSGNGNATGNGGGQSQGGQNEGGPGTSNEPDVGVSQAEGNPAPIAKVVEALDAGGLGFVPDTMVIAAVQDIPGSPGDIPEEDAVLTSQVSTVLETVLPPGVVDVVLSPLLVAEILSKTIMADGQKVLIPVSLLALCAVVIAFGDRLTAGSSLLLSRLRRVEPGSPASD